MVKKKVKLRLPRKWKSSLTRPCMLWKSAVGPELPAIEREVIALTIDGRLVFAHRPEDSWTGKNIATGEVKTYYPKKHDAGGWNLPDIKWWLDIEIPLCGE